MTREERTAIRGFGMILEGYLEDYPKETEKIFKKWKKGMLTGAEAIDEILTIAVVRDAIERR